MIHGLGASLESWNDVYEPLSALYQVVTIDLKGHGFSAKPDDDNYTVHDQARLVVGFITALELKRVILVGHSLGGGVALLTYFESQDRMPSFEITGMVLIDSAGYPQSFPFFVTAIQNPLTRFFMYLASPELRARFLLERVFSVTAQITPDRVYRYAFFYDLPGSHHALEQTVKDIVPANIDELLKRYKCIEIPTLIIWGERDPVIPITSAYRFHEDITNSEITVFDGTGHVPHEERPKEFLERVVEFLRQLQ